MKYSLVNGERREPQNRLKGQCPVCSNPTIAKCGNVRVRHWAHKGKLECDPWWENETEWHRAWKNYFPKDWQEVMHYDNKGERHIADVKTTEGLVLEFQHSAIKPEERIARNAFYKRIVWIVDGAKRTRDKEQFFKFLHELDPVATNPQVRKVCLGESAQVGKCVLLREWSGTNVPVFFDFGEEDLWCLLPAAQNIFGYVVAFPRHGIIDLHNNGADQTKFFEDYLSKLNLAAQVTLVKHPKLNARQSLDPLEMARRAIARRGPRINTYTRYRR